MPTAELANGSRSLRVCCLCRAPGDTTESVSELREEEMAEMLVRELNDHSFLREAQWAPTRG